METKGKKTERESTISYDMKLSYWIHLHCISRRVGWEDGTEAASHWKTYFAVATCKNCKAHPHIVYYIHSTHTKSLNVISLTKSDSSVNENLHIANWTSLPQHKTYHRTHGKSCILCGADGNLLPGKWNSCVCVCVQQQAYSVDSEMYVEYKWTSVTSKCYKKVLSRNTKVLNARFSCKIISTIMFWKQFQRMQAVHCEKLWINLMQYSVYEREIWRKILQIV